MPVHRDREINNFDMPLPHPLTTYSSYNFQIAVFNIDRYIPFPMVTSGVAAGEIRDGAEIRGNYTQYCAVIVCMVMQSSHMVV